MDVVIGIAVLLAIAWVVSKSKVLTGILNVIGTAMNIFWGVGFIALAVWGLVDGDMELWMVALSIGVGIYFLWPTRARRDRRAATAEAAPVMAHAESRAVAGAVTLANDVQDPATSHADDSSFDG